MATQRRWRAAHRRLRRSFTIREYRENGDPMDARSTLANDSAPPEGRDAGKMLQQRVHYLPWQSRALIVPYLQKRQFGPKDESGKSIFSSMGSNILFRTIADQISSFVATTLILIPVITLHFVNSADTRLIIIVVFSLAFQALVVLATEAKRSEVFVATAAFVAIQVVYVGSALGSS